MGDEGEGGAVEPPPVSNEETRLEEARRLYELTKTPVSAIRERFGWTPHQLRKIRKRWNWSARPQRGRASPLSGIRPLREEALEYQLNRLVTIGTVMLGRKFADEGMTEANARTLRELCRAQESRMRTTRIKNGKIRETKSDDVGGDYRNDPDWLIAELRRRLVGPHPENAGSGPADAAGTDKEGEVKAP
jgi:hypothetical protein